jgi:glycerophosphoryl diester phosphodiesterase
VIERDGGSGNTALFRRVYSVEYGSGRGNGLGGKSQLVDLAAIRDPDLISLPELHPGDVGLGDPFRVTCESIEALLVESHARLVLACDNNLPNRGRNLTLADDNELIVVEAPGL